jgi:DedD protein
VAKPPAPPAKPAPEPAKPAAPADAARAKALLEGKPAAPVAADGARFVVQVGAYADAASARETRLKVEKLGLKTYTQVAETASGSRIRVRLGPYNSRDEAEKVLAKTKAAGIDGVVLTL